MFGFFPFFNNDFNNPYNRIGGVGNTDYDLFNGIVDSLLSSDMVNSLVNDLMQDTDYDVELKEYDTYYLIKGYLPGIGPKDVSIDFEKNKAILTIKRKQTFTNGSNSIVTVIQSGGNIVKNFYIGEVDVSSLRASFDNSLLLLTIPKVKKCEDIVSRGVDPTIIDVDNYTIE